MAARPESGLDVATPAAARSATGDATAVLAEHFFRHQSGRLIAALTRALGVRRIELIEDVVQAAFLQALGSWGVRGVPADPGAWLFHVARHRAIDALRRERRNSTLDGTDPSAPDADAALASVRFEHEIADDQLRLLVLCCHPALAQESQLALALRMLGGFGPVEIARALLTTEAGAERRLSRAKARLREETPADLGPDELRARLPVVLSVIYLLFNEGYSSCRTDELIRAELCAEALRLGQIVTDHPACRLPAAAALMAVMCFHAARLNARESADGRLLLLDEQPRESWDGELIARGLAWLRESASGDELSPFHLEAAIASEHCLAPTFRATNWARVVELYDLLVASWPTVVHRLNRAVAVAYAHGAQAGLNALAHVHDAPKEYHLWDAVLGELHRRNGDLTRARAHLTRALQLVKTELERRLIEARLLAAGGELPSTDSGAT